MFPAIGRLDRGSGSCCETSVSGTAVAGSRTQQTAIEVVTADGDRVTLSASLTRTFVAARATAEEGTASATAVTSAAHLAVSVEGSLSRDELEDIGRLVRMLQKAARPHARTDPERLARRLAHAGLETIDRVSAAFASSVTRQRIAGADVERVPRLEPSSTISPAA